MVIPTLKTCYFEASEDIMTKFKSQALHTEGSGQFIFPHIHQKTIPAQPRVFLGSPGLC